MTDKEKLLKLRKLADTMYYAAQYLTTDASRLHKAMDDYHQFIVNDYHEEETVNKQSVDEAMAEVEEKAKAFTEAHKGESSEQLLAEMRGEDSVSEDLEEAIGEYCSNPDNFITYIDVGFKQSPIKKDDIPLIIKAIKFGAKWKEQQMIKDSVLCGVDGWFINNKRNCRKNGRFHKYYVSTITHDKPLPMENGKDYRLIVIKED